MTAAPLELLEARLAELAERVQPSLDGWERIQARARRHDQRRRAGVAAVLSLAAVAATLVALPRVLRGGPPTGVSVQSPPGHPAVGGVPPSGQAAWVADGKLWLLAGAGPARAVPGSSPARDPQWSHDGRWVSYLRRPGGSGISELWVVRPDGSGNRRLWTGKLGGFAWSPAAPELAISAAPAVGAGGLSVVGTDSTSRQVVTDTVEVNSFAWSGDGRSIAYAEVRAPAAQFNSPLQILAVHGPGEGTATAIYQAEAGEGIVVAGWWPGDTGLLFWLEPSYSKAIEADGLPLLSLPVAGHGTPTPLGTTLVYLPWVAWAPDGRVLVVVGSGRLPSSHKSLAICTPSNGACTALPLPVNTVALDPAWSPDFHHIAFVVAGERPAANAEWYSSRQLWVADAADLARAHPVPGASPGAAMPSWSADGQVLRYSSAQGVEAIAATGGQPQRLSGIAPLTGTAGLDGPTAYGKAGWTGHAVWAG